MNKSKNGKRKITNYYKFFTSLSIVIILIAIIVFLVFQLVSNLSKSDSDGLFVQTGNQEEKIVEEIPDITINIAAIGDAMCHSPNYKAAYNASTGEYDFSRFFTNISTYTSSADLTIGNLETTFAGKARGYSGYPTFNTPSTFGNALKDIGIDVLSTANNHSMDKGYNGVVSTLDTLDELSISHTGTYRSIEEQNQILVKDVNGIKIAFLAFTYGTNGMPIPSGKEYCINLIDKDLMKQQIDLAKAEEVDLICASMHWGVEYQRKQNAEQEDLATFLFENGVDIIFGSHPHVLQPMEKRTITLADGTTKDGFVIFSLGNFISNQNDEYTNDTVILNLQVTKHSDGTITIDEATYIPVYVYDKNSGGLDRYKLLDIRTSMADYEAGKGNISSSLYKTLSKRLEKITTTVGPEIKQETENTESIENNETLENNINS